MDKYYPLLIGLAGLASLAVLVYWFFFNIARDRKLAEKEEKILKLYVSLEDVMDDYKAFVEASVKDIDQKTADLRTAAQAATTSPPPAPIQSQSQPQPQLVANNSAPSSAQPPKPTGFEAFIPAEDPAPDTLPPAPVSDGISEKEPSAYHAGRKERIRELADAGMNPVSIAREMNIARTEVELVLGMKNNFKK